MKYRLSFSFVFMISLLAACSALPTASPQPEHFQTGQAPSQSVSSLYLLSFDAGNQSIQVQQVDPSSGVPIKNGKSFSKIASDSIYIQHVFSKSGRWLALMPSLGQACEPYAGGTSCQTAYKSIDFLDLQSGAQISATLPESGWINALDFRPDASSLALALHNSHGTSLLIYETTSGKLISQLPLSIVPERIFFNVSGDKLTIYGTNPGPNPSISEPQSPEVLILNPSDLSIVWQTRLDSILNGYWCIENCDKGHELMHNISYQPAAIPSPDGNMLYILHADQPKLTSIDLLQYTTTTQSISPSQTWIERLLSMGIQTAHAKGPMDGGSRSAVISPDGRFIYSLGWAYSSTPEVVSHSLGLQMIETSTTHEIQHSDIQAYQVHLMPSGELLLLQAYEVNGWRASLVDPNNLAVIQNYTGFNYAPAMQPDGALFLAAASDGYSPTHLAILDAYSGEAIREWTQAGKGIWLAP